MQSPAYFNQKELHQQRRRRSHRPQTHQNSGQKDQQQQTSTDPKSFSPIKTSDYGEIFGGYSYSIPVLDLPPVPCADVGSGTSCFRSSVPIDLVDIFGGFADSRFGVPYEEILNHGTSASSLNGGFVLFFFCYFLFFFHLRSCCLKYHYHQCNSDMKFLLLWLFISR